ncbi:MAG TPA: type II secretion system F family protein [Candidatus Acidoferrales bacterium]|nr:type II secretion system F family protein [Candidatus Acidoferrales bacterium]
MAATFFYRARTPEGSLVSGSIVAERTDEVIAHLRTRALFVTSVAEANSLAGSIERVRTMRSVSPPPLVVFFRSFATLIRAGVSVARSLNVAIAQCSDGRLREALRAVLAEIENGRSVSTAMRQHPREFAPLYVAMVEAGEAGGLLDEVLDRVATMLEKDRVLRSKVGASLAYPVIVLCAAFALVFVLLSTLVPEFGRMFAQMDVPLPASTRILIAFGELLHQPFFAGALIVLGVGSLVVLTLAYHHPPAAAAIDRLRLRIPFLGTVHRKAVIARLSRMLGSLLHSGVDVLRSIDVVAPVAGNRAYSDALRSLHAALRDGDSMADQLERSNLFEPMVLQMVRVGEETGSLDTMLLKTAEYYEADVESSMATLSTTLEPALILVVGAVVGFIVFSVFVPMYSLISQIR